MNRSRPVILQAAYMAVKGTQEAALFEGPLQADKADSSNPVRLWTLGELVLPSDWLHLQRDMQAEDDLVEGWVLPLCSAEIKRSACHATCQGH